MRDTILGNRKLQIQTQYTIPTLTVHIRQNKLLMKSVVYDYHGFLEDER